MKKAIPLLFAILCLLALSGCGSPAVEYDAKPVLYLYPEEETTVNVQLDYHGQLTTTYPAYGDSWTVTAHPDGTLTDPATGGPTTASSGKGSPRWSMTSRKALWSPARTPPPS